MTFDIPATVVPAHPSLNSKAKQFADSIGATFYNLNEVSSKVATSSAFIVIATPKISLNLAWHKIAVLKPTIPIVRLVNDPKWDGINNRTCEKPIFLRRPTIEKLQQECISSSILFVAAHGRSDSISLANGKLCGRFHGESTHLPQTFAPTCIISGQCYRNGMPAVTAKELSIKALVTNACESIAFGSSSLISSPWTLADALFRDGVETLIGTPFVRNGNTSEIELAAGLFSKGMPIWQVLHILNSAASTSGLDTPGLVLRGNPFLYTNPELSFTTVDINSMDEGEVIVDGATQITIGDVNIDVVMPIGGRSVYSVAPSKPGAVPSLWMVGNGNFKIKFNENQSLKERLFQEELAEQRTSKLFQAVRQSSKEMKLQNAWRDTIRSARRYLIEALYNTSAAKKLTELINQASLQQQRLSDTFLERVCSQTTSGQKQDILDELRLNLLVENSSQGTRCPVCNAMTVFLLYQGGWRQQRCPRCGIVEFLNNNSLIDQCIAPHQCGLGENFWVKVLSEVSTRVAIQRGAREGISVFERKGSDICFKTSDKTPLHYLSIRCYSFDKGNIHIVCRPIHVR